MTDSGVADSRIEIDSESVYNNHFKIDIHNFPIGRLALREQCEEPTSLVVVPFGKSLNVVLPSLSGRQVTDSP